MGPPSSRSSAFPCGRPSITSKRTTSPRPFSAARCASVPPIIPAPMSAIFLRAMVTSLGLPGFARVHVERVTTEVALRVVRALCNIHEAGGRQPRRERLRVVSVEVILAEAEAQLVEVDDDRHAGESTSTGRDEKVALDGVLTSSFATQVPKHRSHPRGDVVGPDRVG